MIIGFARQDQIFTVLDFDNRCI